MTRIKIQREKSEGELQSKRDSSGGLNNFLKKFAFIALALAIAAFANEEVPFEKEGFLTTQGCAESGSFADCHFENYSCGSDGCYMETEAGVDHETPLVLFSHDDGVIYKLDTSAVKRSELDHGVGRNAVSVVGEYDANTSTIVVREFKAPPPPKKSFFKGCL